MGMRFHQKVSEDEVPSEGQWDEVSSEGQWG